MNNKKKNFSIRNNHRNRIVKLGFIDSKDREVYAYSLNIHKTALYKDGNKLGLRKRNDFLKYYDEKIEGRLENIKKGDFLSSEELNSILKDKQTQSAS